MKFNKDFVPDYTNIVDAAYNRPAKRMPIYDHLIGQSIMETILNNKFVELAAGNDSERREYYKNFCKFFKTLGYDTVIYEASASSIMPGSGALGSHKDGIIITREDFENYPWDEIPALYFEKYAEHFKFLGEAMPAGMKATGGVGNGVFECVQDIVGYIDLCYIKEDDRDLYSDLFTKVGDMLVAIWSRFLKSYGDIYCVCRFGDDLGFKSNTLLPHDDVRKLIIPQYKRIVELVHSYNKPFLLHSCGQIFDVMDDIVKVAKIDAKHSNEDVIAPFSTWVERYGDKIGNFGGIDTDVICSDDEKYVKEYTLNVIRSAEGHGGFAIGSGNSVPDYVSVTGYLAMNEAARAYRGE